MEFGFAFALFLGLASTFVAVVEGQVPFLGRCPDHQVVQDFETERYLGRWYEHQKYFAIFEAGGRCIQADYSFNEDATIRVVNSQIQEKNGQLRRIEGYARPLTTDGSAKFGVTFPSLPTSASREAPYWVLDTDYYNYAIVWSCSDYTLLNLQFLWVLTRERLPSPELISHIHAKLDQLKVRRDRLIPTNQTNCGV